ncbi:hypothetical protein CERZMDRAFT_93832 [Cercospora zeae-maydis SCOH1-5]|uniref:Uncharacterized protein n=1 Tax=Cercospora zeae-maydis SCOH1-5 TaxID=717836 RepID=A0A6A6FT29_9PEZI|nr:hypothetical protein CERZMDRAFT_93832 [Cercospora zeae-maydis SCOH1-5]
MENGDMLTIAASIALIVWSLVMNTLYDAEQHREKMAAEGEAAGHHMPTRLLHQTI